MKNKNISNLIQNLSSPVISIKRLLYRYSHFNWALADQAIVSGVNFLTNILIARYLGIEEFGRFSLAWMAVLFVSSIQHAGINSPMMSIGPKKKNKEMSFYYGAVFGQHLLFSLFSMILIYLVMIQSVIYFPHWHIHNHALSLSVTCFTYITQDFLRRYFFTIQQPLNAFLNDTISYLGQFFCLFLLFQTTSQSTEKVLWIISGTSIIAIIFSFFRLEPIKLNFTIFLLTTKRHWQFSKWLIASAILQWSSGNLFIVVAASYIGVVAAGVLRAVQNIMGVIHVLFNGLENVLPIQASKIFHESGPNVLTKYLLRIFKSSGIIVWGTVILVFLFPKFWLSSFYGTEFVDYAYILQWYGVIYIFVYIGLFLRIGLRAIEYTRPIFWAYGLMTVFAVLSARPMTQIWGLVGSVLGILITQIIFQGSMLYSFRYAITKSSSEKHN